MKKNNKAKTKGLNPKEIEVGYLYFTAAGQFRAVLAMNSEFMVYAPSSEGLDVSSLNSSDLPFENSPFKKCQIVTFAKKDYQEFEFNGIKAVRHLLTQAQIEQATIQCNAKAAVAELLKES